MQWLEYITHFGSEEMIKLRVGRNPLERGFEETSQHLNRLFNRAFKPEKTNISLIPLGGQKFIGGPNSWLIESPNGEQLMVDLGQMITERDDGADIPDHTVPMLGRVNHQNLKAIILSHGHLDHILAVPTLLAQRPKHLPPLPVYGSDETLLVLKRVLENADDNDQVKVNLDPIRLENHQQIGDFKVSAYPILHSIPGSRCFVVEVGEKKILYLPDFKLARNNRIEYVQTLKMLQNIGNSGIDVMLMDSSNADTPGYTPSVQALIVKFAEILRENPGSRIIVSLFASDIETTADLSEVALSDGRSVEAFGRTMVFFFNHFMPPTYDEDSEKPPVFFVTGCQAEPYSALELASRSMNVQFSFEPDDVVVILSRMIPGNQTRISEMKGKIRNFGCKVIDMDSAPEIRVSGHESLEGLLDAVLAVSPEVIIPVHGPEWLRKTLGGEIWRRAKDGRPSAHSAFFKHLTVRQMRDGELYRI